MRNHWRTAAALLAAGTLVAMDVRSVIAVPAFARREQAPCQMCHFRIPELNATGRAYLRHGLRQESTATPTGADGNASSTSQPLGLPLNVNWSEYLTVMGHHDFILQKGAKPSFDAGGVDLWVGGPIDSHWSGLANPSFDAQNGGSSVDIAYGQYVTKAADRFYSARFGQVSPYAVRFNGGGPTNVSLTVPLILGTAGDTNFSWTPASFVRGVEMGAVGSPNWNVYVGAGQPHLDQPPAAPLFQNHTDLYASAERSLDARGDSLTAYGYWGHAWLTPTATNQAFNRLGLFGNYANYQIGLKVIAGYMAGNDNAADGRSLHNSGFFLLGEHLVTDRWAVYGRYDRLRQDLDAGGAQTIDGPTLGASYWASSEVWLTLETQSLRTTNQPSTRGAMLEFSWIF